MAPEVDIVILDRDVTMLRNSLAGLTKYLRREKTIIDSVLDRMSSLETSNNYRLQTFEKWKESMEPMQLQMVQIQSRIDVLVAHMDQLKGVLNDIKQTEDQFALKFEKISQLVNSVGNANKEIIKLRKEFDTAKSTLQNDLKLVNSNVDGQNLKIERILNVKTVIFAIGAAIVGLVTVISIVKDWIHIAPVVK